MNFKMFPLDCGVVVFGGNYTQKKAWMTLGDLVTYFFSFVKFGWLRLSNPWWQLQLISCDQAVQKMCPLHAKNKFHVDKITIK